MPLRYQRSTGARSEAALLADKQIRSAPFLRHDHHVATLRVGRWWCRCWWCWCRWRGWLDWCWRSWRSWRGRGSCPPTSPEFLDGDRPGKSVPRKSPGGGFRPFLLQDRGAGGHSFTPTAPHCVHRAIRKAGRLPRRGCQEGLCRVVLLHRNQRVRLGSRKYFVREVPQVPLEACTLGVEDNPGADQAKHNEGQSSARDAKSHRRDGCEGRNPLVPCLCTLSCRLAEIQSCGRDPAKRRAHRGRATHQPTAPVERPSGLGLVPVDSLGLRRWCWQVRGEERRDEGACDGSGRWCKRRGGCERRVLHRDEATRGQGLRHRHAHVLTVRCGEGHLLPRNDGGRYLYLERKLGHDWWHRLCNGLERGRQLGSGRCIRYDLLNRRHNGHDRGVVGAAHCHKEVMSHTPSSAW
mmetsp:Transcript_87839/g.179153  ORF Transcript_87839/g.179153 Transcript_87839/m.179153 type:complete len:408 (+) Transcript_87839:41-1264(+)